MRSACGIKLLRLLRGKLNLHYSIDINPEAHGISFGFSDAVKPAGTFLVQRRERERERERERGGAGERGKKKAAHGGALNLPDYILFNEAPRCRRYAATYARANGT